MIGHLCNPKIYSFYVLFRVAVFAFLVKIVVSEKDLDYSDFRRERMRKG
jgi:hypothetical protein